MWKDMKGVVIDIWIKKDERMTVMQQMIQDTWRQKNEKHITSNDPSE